MRKNLLHRAWIVAHYDILRPLKLRLISVIHKRWPQHFCWADCVAWAYDPARHNILKIDSPAACLKESETDPQGACYCGGCVEGCLNKPK